MSWKTVRIKDFAEVITGGTPSTSKKEYWNNGDIPWLNSGELNQGLILSSSNFITKSGLENSAAKLMPPNTVLIALTGATTGVTGYLGIEACANQSVTGVIPSDKHHPKFLYYYLGSIRNRILNDSYGGAQKHISQGYVKDICVPLPPLPTQKKIAAILDQADALRKKDQQLLAKYDELLQAVFYDMFGDPVRNEKGWEKVKLRSIIRDDDKINYGVVQPGDEHKGGVPIIRVGDLEEMMVNQTNLKKISPDIEKNYKRSRLVGDEILIGCVGSIGTIALADESLKGFNIVRATARVRTDENKANRLYIANHLNAPVIQNYFVKETRTVSQPTLNISHIEETPILLPPLEFQKQFASIAQNIQYQKQMAKKQVQQSETLFQSLLQLAFKGELVKE